VAEFAKSTKYNQADVETLYELFYNLTDGNCLLDKSHLQDRLGLSSVRKPLFIDRFYDCIRGKSQKIGFSEYITTINVLLRGEPDERLKFCFRVFDVSGHEQIQRAEVRLIMESLLDCAVAVAETLVAGIVPSHQSNFKRLECEVRLNQKSPTSSSNEIQKWKIQSVSAPAAAKELGQKAGIAEDTLNRCLDAFFDAADSNRDGKISLKEFRNWAQRDSSFVDTLVFYARVLSSSQDLASLLLSRV